MNNIVNEIGLFSVYTLLSLENAILDLKSYFRLTWPNESITPKLHMLEDHAVNFIKRWGTGFGFYGEQGAESTHNNFSNLQRTYARMPDSRRLESMMKEHLTHPVAKKMRPQIKKRKFRDI